MRPTPVRTFSTTQKIASQKRFLTKLTAAISPLLAPFDGFSFACWVFVPGTTTLGIDWLAVAVAGALGLLCAFIVFFPAGAGLPHIRCICLLIDDTKTPKRQVSGRRPVRGFAATPALVFSGMDITVCDCVSESTAPAFGFFFTGC